MLGKTEGRKKWAAKDEMVGEYHQLNGHESEQTPGDSEGQEAWCVACSAWGCKESYMIDGLNKNNKVR